MAQTYNSIATVSLSGVNTYTFSSIPSSYTDLVLTFNGNTSASTYVNFRFNGDTAGNYSYTNLYYSGSTVSGTGGGSQTFGLGGPVNNTGTSAFTLDINSYSSSVLQKHGFFHGIANAQNDFGVTWWHSAAVINSITIYTANAGNWTSNSVATLYGIAKA
jgi:hypothetical protein